MTGKKTKTPDSVKTPSAENVPAPRYVVLARKYRPQTFTDLIGQDAMVTTLRNAFASGRIAQGYMLTGVRGVGKTTTARILARALNYSRLGETSAPTIDMPELGAHCTEIMEGRHPDVLEIDAASNTGVDSIRELIENARYMPLVARYKVFIIDEVHMLSRGAFNALLKTLEEPPEHVKFIFATTEIRKVPVTVLSRCQRFDLRRVEAPLLAEHLNRITSAEKASADEESLLLIARMAGGSVRDALSVLDQAIALGQGTVTGPAVRAMLGLADRGRIHDLAERVLAGDIKAALDMFADLNRDGADPVQSLADLAEAVHLVARIKAAGGAMAGATVPSAERLRAEALATATGMGLLSRTFQMLLKGHEETARAPMPLAAAEMVLIRIAYAAGLPSPDDLIAALGEGTSPKEVSPKRERPAPPRDVGSRGDGARASGDLAGEAVVSPIASAALQPFPTEEGGLFTDEDAGDTDTHEVDHDDDDDDDRFAPPTIPAPQGERAGEEHPTKKAATPVPARWVSFEELVAFVGTQRDAKLKVHLEDHVSLVRFDPVGCALDVFLLPMAPSGFANTLREKLMAWSGQRWVIVLSKAPGAEPLGSVRRARAASELEDLKKHPAVAAFLTEFPEAKIARITPMDGPGETVAQNQDRPIGRQREK